MWIENAWLSKTFASAIGCWALLLAGCAAPHIHVNTPAGPEDQSVPRAGFRVSSVSSCIGSKSDRPNCENDVALVGLAISGGGSRAANYSAAVMSELDRIGILQHVNVISSVSGGSLAAAYYATRSNNPLRLRDKKLFWENAKGDLSRDFRSAFVAKLLRPDNFAKSMFGPVGRTDVMAQVFDEYIFAGARYGDLDNIGPGLIINATAINDLHSVVDQTECSNRRGYAQSMKWESIPFTEGFFNDCLNSTISTYPLSHAVAASAAFPGLFSSVTLARFWPDEKFEKVIPLEYLHVIDGGPSDNLGIDGILSDWAAKSRAKKSNNIGQCLIIVIDAFASGETDLRNLKPDSRTVFDRFVDLNFFDSIDAMLSRRRLETLRNLDLPPPRPGIDKMSVFNFPVKGHTFHFWDGKRVAENVNPFTALGGDMYRLPLLPKYKYGDARDPLEPRDPACMVWYIGIDSLKDLVAPNWEFLVEPDTPYYSEREFDEYDAAIKEHFATDEARNRTALWDLASRIRTDFNLMGSKNCTSKVLSDVLWTAGSYSVNADVDSRRKVCTWLSKAGMATSKICAEPVSAATRSFPIKYVAHANGDYSVECE